MSYPLSRSKYPWIAFLCALLASLSTLCTAYFYQIAHIYGTDFYISPGVLFVLQLIILYFPAIAMGIYALGCEPTGVDVESRRGLAFTALIFAGLGLTILPLTITVWMPYERGKIYEKATELTSPDGKWIACTCEHRSGKIVWWQDKKVVSLWVTDKQRKFRSHIDVLDSGELGTPTDQFTRPQESIRSAFRSLAWSKDSSKLAYIKAVSRFFAASGFIGDSIHIVEILDVPDWDYTDEKLTIKYTTRFPNVAFYPAAFIWYPDGKYLCLSGFLGLEDTLTDVNVIATGSIKGGKLNIHVFFPAISKPDEKQFELNDGTITFAGRDRQAYYIPSDEVADDNWIADVQYAPSRAVTQYPSKTILTRYEEDIQLILNQKQDEQEDKEANGQEG